LIARRNIRQYRWTCRGKSASSRGRSSRSTESSRRLARTRARVSLVELEHQRSKTEDLLELTKRQITDLGEHVARAQAELEEARQQALYDAFVEALSQRDAAAQRATAQLEAALEALEALARFAATVYEEPGELAEAWDKVVARVRAELDEKLEDGRAQASRLLIRG
jgi:hypothetical protein